MLYTYVKIDESIKACIREEIVSCKPIDLVSAAVNYGSLDMQNTYLAEKIISLEKSLQKKGLTEEEVKAIKIKIAKYNAEIEQNTEIMVVLKPKWEYTLNFIADAHNEYVKNDMDAIRNVFRLTSCQENRLYKYVVVNGEDNALLYEAMERIHQIDGQNVDDLGRIEDSEERYSDYNFSAMEIGKIVKSLFSIPIESELTKKVNVKFNKTDLAYIHSLYVKSMSVRFSNNKTNGEMYGGRVLRTLIQCKKNKDGIKEYDFSAFYEVVSKLAIEYLVK